MKGYAVALAFSVLLLATAEWRTDEDLVAVIALVATSCGLGLLRPRLFRLSALVLGCVVGSLNILTALTGLRPIYESAAQVRFHSIGYDMSLLVLTLPAFVAAGAGAILRRFVGAEQPVA